LRFCTTSLVAAEASLHSSLVHSSLDPDEHWLLCSSQLGGKWNGEHGLVAAAESLSFKDVSGQCRGDGARSAGVASSIAGWVLPMLNRSCDALAMKERPCVRWLVHRIARRVPSPCNFGHVGSDGNPQPNRETAETGRDAQAETERAPS